MRSSCRVRLLKADLLNLQPRRRKIIEGRPQQAVLTNAAQLMIAAGIAAPAKLNVKQRLIQVRNDVFHVLDSHRKPDQSFRNSDPLLRFLWH
jgi:hypothetical protein